MENTPEQEYVDGNIRSTHNQEVKPEDSILIDNTPPYFDFLKPLLAVPLETVLKESRKHEKPYLAWQAVRHAPGGKNLTGLEGYFLGESAKVVSDNIIEIGRRSLASLNRDPLLKQEVFNTLLEKNVTSKALYWLNAELGSITAKLRAQASRNQRASEFRDSIYQKLGDNSQISYKIEQNLTRQIYRIPVVVLPTEITSALNQSTESLNDPAYYLSLMGKVGHPLVRASFRYIDR